MGLTIRKERNRYHLIEKETGKIKKSFDTKGEALAYREDEEEEKPIKVEFTGVLKKYKGGKQ